MTAQGSWGEAQGKALNGIRFGTFTDGGRKYAVFLDLRIETVQAAIARGKTIDHQPVPAGSLEMAIQGTCWRATADGRIDRRFADCDSAGQIREELRRVGTPAALRVAELWDRWHCNGTRPNCSHMPDQRYTRGLACPETGYRSGSAWLCELLPAEVADEALRLFAEQAAKGY
jgi:hypothetical protein